VTKAKKNHRCYWCGEWIPIGSSYYYEAQISEGDFGTLSLHLECKITVDEYVEDSSLYGEELPMEEHKRGSLEEKYT
jgi:hypothetical protein